MLKISIVDTRTRRRLVLEGALIPPWSGELKAAWKKARIGAQDRKIVLDFKNVIRISAEGEEVLSELVKEGAKFSSGGVLTKHILQQLTQKQKPNKGVRALRIGRGRRKPD
jgi:hypothetical protein